VSLDTGWNNFDHGTDPILSGTRDRPTLAAKASTSLVRAETLHRRLNLSRPRLLPVVVLVLVCALVGETHGSNVSGSALFDAESHAKDCKCGSKCRGASCCCGSPRTTPKPSLKVAIPNQADLAKNPCLNSAPCGDPIAPRSAPLGSYFKVAALVSIEGSPPRDGGQPLVVPTSSLSTDRRANRLDRPPRIVGLT
jgi:hypothetical protein